MNYNINKELLLLLTISFWSILSMAQGDNTFYMDDNSAVTIQAGAVVHVEGDFHMDASSDLDNAGTIELQGDWRFESATVDLTTAGGADEQGLILFQNNILGNPHNVGAVQSIYAPADMLGTAAFYDIDFNNDGDMLDLNGGSIEIKNTLEFKDANDILRTDASSHTTAGQTYAHKIFISNPSVNAIVGSSGLTPNATGGYIEGKLERAITIGLYEFPIGIQKNSADNTEPFSLNITSAPASGTITGYIHDAPSFTANATIFYADVAVHQGSGAIEDFNTALPGTDSYLDKISSECHYSLAWKVETATIGAWDYTFAGYPGTSLQGECSFLSFGGNVLSFMTKDGVPVTEGSTSQSCPSPWIAGTDADGYRVSPIGVMSFAGTTFSEFRVGGSTVLDFANSAMILPVELLSFIGRKEEKWNKLIWQTASEKNVSHFEVERGVNNLDFIKLGEVEARGNSTSSQSYDFDDNDLKPLAYYRLKMIDEDGSYEYSNIIAIQRNTAQHIISIYPNPINDWFMVNASISPNTGIELKIIDPLGRTIYTKEAITDSDGRWDSKIDSSQLPVGMYIVQVVNRNTTEVFTLIKN